MNNNEKISEIRRIISSEKHKQCPYCFEYFHTYRDKEGNEKNSCYNHDEGDIIINIEDYYNAIKNIILYNEPIKLINYKKITDF